MEDIKKYLIDPRDIGNILDLIEETEQQIYLANIQNHK